MRSGTEPVPSIVGFAMASRLAREALVSYDRIAALRDSLEASIQRRVHDTSINGRSQPRLGNTTNIAFHGVPADELVRALDAEGICTSAGAACHSGSAEPSSTMKAMGLPLRVAMGAVRFSLSRFSTKAEIEETGEVVAQLAQRRLQHHS